MNASMNNTSNRIKNVEASPITRLIPYEEEALKNGKTIYHLNIGQPDLKTPKEFFESVREFNKDILTYAHSRGRKELIEEIIKFYKKHFNIDYKYENIFITTGGSEAILFTLLSIFDEGDEVLVSEPYYANYNNFFDVLNIKVNAFTADPKTGFHLPAREEIISKITPKTKAIVLTNPGNPTGVVYREEEIRLIGEIAKEYGLYIISDEVYKVFSYGKNRAISFGEIEGIEENVILIESISKIYSACGARIGAVISKNENLMNEIYKLCQARLSVSTLDMVGAEGLYKKLSDDYFEKNRIEYEKRRDIVYDGISKIEGIEVTKPEGAFYVMVTLPMDNTEDFCIWLLTDFDLDGETIMLSPAEGFYTNKELGRNKIRISYCIEAEKLKKSIKILEAGLKEYLSKKKLTR
ncbi:pyridoxal phosphate-dependent aminotransferase [Fusobacterium sp. MFO224]|uniref:pyridoxal phosphate-dependent aminotransferase n=1 Tax=Fusobacterium sp. MFO224 TaxID=3378070 RepID=UPI00385303E8